MLRWDDAVRKVREKGVNLPHNYLGFLMVNALHVSSDQTELQAWVPAGRGCEGLADLNLSNLGNEKKKTTTEIHRPQDELYDLEDDQMMDEEGAQC